ncbi:hypothetical protein D9611_011746 [Ephemerocybe angulata]|uniref:Uncharacterized protein n=1 Tax=Ephemerocybe angulata TaxID=980116 RepID=A0A8H5C4Y0_9AGAR|nr:hypothetical protein D9611_011746 [Tulosesus angulatus]
MAIQRQRADLDSVHPLPITHKSLSNYIDTGATGLENPNTTYASPSTESARLSAQRTRRGAGRPSGRRRQGSPEVPGTQGPTPADAMALALMATYASMLSFRIAHVLELEVLSRARLACCLGLEPAASEDGTSDDADQARRTGYLTDSGYITSITATWLNTKTVHGTKTAQTTLEKPRVASQRPRSLRPVVNAFALHSRVEGSVNPRGYHSTRVEEGLSKTDCRFFQSLDAQMSSFIHASYTIIDEQVKGA